MIPRIIWQTHEWAEQDLLERHIKSTKSWKTVCSNWEYRYVPASERRAMVETHYPSLLEVYDKFRSPHEVGLPGIGGMMQADIWRMVVVYTFGGIYADMDSLCLISPDDIDTIYPDKELITMGPKVFFHDRMNSDQLNNLLDLQIAGPQSAFSLGKFRVLLSMFAGQPGNSVLGEVLETIASGDYKTEDVFSRVALSHPDKVAYDFRWGIHKSYVDLNIVI